MHKVDAAVERTGHEASRRDRTPTRRPCVGRRPVAALVALGTSVLMGLAGGMLAGTAGAVVRPAATGHVVTTTSRFLRGAPSRAHNRHARWFGIAECRQYFGRGRNAERAGRGGRRGSDERCFRCGAERRCNQRHQFELCHLVPGRWDVAHSG